MPNIRAILAPVDFSELASAALAKAFDLATALHAQVHLVHAYNVPAFPDAMAMGVDLLGPVQQAATQALALERDKYANRPELASAVSRMGAPAEVILQRARELPANLIVMGSHGRGGFQHLLLGSVAERVVRGAPCPVLVVPPAKASATK